jgi:hypothetical protein
MQSQNWPTVPFGSYRTWDSGGGQGRWDTVETSQGNYNWTTVDQYVGLAQSKGVPILMELGSTPAWASSNPSQTGCDNGPGTCAPPANLTDFDNWVTALVTRYQGRIQAYELWNEANTPAYWVGSIPTMVTMAQHAYRIIKSLDPNALVLSPSVTNTNNTAGPWLNSYLAAGGGQYADVIAFHGYFTYVTPEGDANYVIGTAIRGAMSANGASSKPLWDTESSWGVDSALSNSDDQVSQLARHLLIYWSMGVARSYWYAWDNDTWGTLWDPTSGIHPAGTAYQQIHDWMVGATLTAPCSQASDGTWSCPFTRSGGYQALAVWNPVQSLPFIAPSQFHTYRMLNGASKAISGAITIGRGPVLLESTMP